MDRKIPKRRPILVAFGTDFLELGQTLAALLHSRSIASSRAGAERARHLAQRVPHLGSESTARFDSVSRIGLNTCLASIHLDQPIGTRRLA